MIFDDHQVKNVLLVKTIHTYTKRFLLAIGKKKFFSHYKYFVNSANSIRMWIWMKWELYSNDDGGDPRRLFFFFFISRRQHYNLCAIDDNGVAHRHQHRLLRRRRHRYFFFGIFVLFLIIKCVCVCIVSNSIWIR